MTKPGDFLLGVLDFFAILLPGSMATWLLTRYISPADMSRLLSFGPLEFSADSWVLTGAFLLSSYTLGHFVFMAGSRLDTSYDRWMKRAKASDRDKTYREADKIRKQVMESSAFTTLKWAKSYIEIRVPHARGEIDRLEADSKFFRSLVVIAAVMALHFLITERNPRIGAAFIALGAAAYWRFCDRRWRSTELSYATAIIIYKTKPPGRSQKGSKSGEDGEDK